MLLGGEVAAARSLRTRMENQNLDLIEPRGVLGREVEGDAVTGIAQECLACRHRLEDAGYPRRSCAKSPVAVRFRRCPSRLPPGRRSEPVPLIFVALNAPAPNRSVAVHTHPTIAPVKPCEPARYPPLQTERTVSHYCWIHMALSSASSFVRNCDKCDSVLPSGVTESSIPTRCTSDVRLCA
jgi:hypothetical protein